eukprot:924627-Rhodomonas_salina.1
MCVCACVKRAGRGGDVCVCACVCVCVCVCVAHLVEGGEGGAVDDSDHRLQRRLVQRDVPFLCPPRESTSPRCEMRCEAKRSEAEEIGGDRRR